MATVNYTLGTDINVALQKATWSNMANGDVGQALHASEFSDRSVQVKGTFGTGGTMQLKGSNDGGTTWNVLRDPFGTNVSASGGNLIQLTELAEYVRPEIVAGDGTTSITVIVYMRKQPD